jgi:Iap family predicted aminopeptidase
VSFGEKPRLVIGAHHDTIMRGDGANDNTASVVELIELADRLTKSGYSGDLRIVFFDHEELMCRGEFDSMGSAEYVRGLSEREKHLGNATREVIVLDVCGAGDMIVISSLWNKAKPAAPFEEWLFRRPSVVRLTTPPSDDVSFLRYGFPVTLICTLPESEIESAARRLTWERLHTTADSVETVNETTMELIVDTLHEYVLRQTL